MANVQTSQTAGKSGQVPFAERTKSAFRRVALASGSVDEALIATAGSATNKLDLSGIDLTRRAWLHAQVPA